MANLSVQTIAAITEVITGGSGYSRSQPVGIYRTGPTIEHFFAGINMNFSIVGSRVPSVRSFLSELNSEDDNGFNQLVKVIEAAAHPREYLHCPEKTEAVVEYLNQRLIYDGYRLIKEREIFKLVSNSTNRPAASQLLEKLNMLDMESVKNNFERALEEADPNPEGAITQACSAVESVCKCILDELNQPYPNKQDISGLVKEVSKHLNLSPGRKDIPAESESDIRQILGGLVGVTNGIGALRTHSGDAHGRGKKRPTVDARMARLAIHAASTISLFYIETWQQPNITGPRVGLGPALNLAQKKGKLDRKM